jgi:hypothetical protein
MNPRWTRCRKRTHHYVCNALAPGATSKMRSCCLSQTDLPITKLLCTTADYTAAVGDTCAVGAPFLLLFAPGADQNILNRFAFMCCTGVLGVVQGILGAAVLTTNRFTCSPTLLFVTGTIIGTCGAPDALALPPSPCYKTEVSGYGGGDEVNAAMQPYSERSKLFDSSS